MNKKLVIVKVGSIEKGWIASRKMMDEAKVALEQAIASDKLKEFLVVHPWITICELDVTAATTVVRLVGVDPDVKDEKTTNSVQLV